MGKKLAAHKCKKREAKKREEQAQLEKSGVNQYYGIGAVIAVGVTGGLGYHIYRTKQSLHGPSRPGVVQRPHTQSSNPPYHPTPRPQTNMSEMDYISSVL